MRFVLNIFRVPFYMAIGIWSIISADPEGIIRVHNSGEKYRPWVLWIARHNKVLWK